MKAWIATIIFLMASPLAAQTWFKVASENDTVAVTAPTTVRYGSGGSWVTQTMSGTFSANNATFGDPIPGTLKELDVLETSAAQTVTVNGTAVSVPAIAAPVTAPTPAPAPAPTGVSVAVSAPSLSVTVPACKIPKNGGTCPQVTIPVVLAPGSTWSLSCPNTPALANGQPDMTKPLNCTLTLVVK